MQHFVTFLLLLFLIAAFLRVDFFFTTVYLFCAVYVLSYLWTRRTERQLSVRRHFVNHAFLGDRIVVDLKVQNTGWLPFPWLRIHESLPVRLTAVPSYRQVFSLGPREKRAFQYTLYCNRRGYYPIGPLTVQAGDLFGIVRRVRLQITPEHIIVYPRVVPLQELGLPTRSPQVALPARSPLFEDPSRVMGVRDYQRGDSPRRIHWTATASAGRLLVKRYQPAIARGTLICLDLDRENYGRRQRDTATELAIVVAASLANHIIVREGLPAGLIAEARDPLLDERVRFSLPLRSERAHLMSMLEVLARVQITSATSFVELVRQASMDLSWGATILVITGRESVELFDNLVYLRQTGFAVALILVQPARTSVEMQERADLLHVPVHRIWNERDLETWQ